MEVIDTEEWKQLNSIYNIDRLKKDYMTTLNKCKICEAFYLSIIIKQNHNNDVGIEFMLCFFCSVFVLLICLLIPLCETLPCL